MESSERGTLKHGGSRAGSVIAARLSGSYPPPCNESTLFSLGCVRNERGEGGHGAVQNIEELTQSTAPVGCLLLQLRHHQRLFLAENLDQEELRVQRADTPRRQMLWPEVAKVEGYDDRRLAVDGGGDYVAVFFIVRHPRNQRLVTNDPGFAEVGAQFLFKMSGQGVRPSKFQFQRLGGLSNNLLGPFRLEESR